VTSDTFIHSLFLLFWFLAFIFGGLFVKTKRITHFKSKSLGKFAINILSLIFLLYGITKLNYLSSLSLNDFATLHESRSEISMSYAEYLFSRSIFILPAVFLFYKSKFIILKFIISIIAIAIAFSSVQKTPFIFLFLSIVIFPILYKNIQIDFRKVFFLMLMFLGFSSLVSFAMYQSDILITIDAVLNRIFLKPGKLAYNAMEMIDLSGLHYYGGASFVTPFSFLGLDNILLGKENYYFTYGSYIGSANTPSLTSAYADFGLFGIIYALLLGILLKLYDNTINYSLENSSNNMRLFISAGYTCSLILTLKLNITVLGSALLGEGLLTSMLFTYIVTYKKTLKQHEYFNN
jgi:oligosaccharide repeat unit polymerase